MNLYSNWSTVNSEDLSQNIPQPGAIFHNKIEFFKKYNFFFQKNTQNHCINHYLPANVAANFHCTVYESAPDRSVQKGIFSLSSFLFFFSVFCCFKIFSLKPKKK